jgi:hypothetical protein
MFRFIHQLLRKTFRKKDKLDIQSKCGKIILMPCNNKIREGWANAAKKANKEDATES